ncbi:MAG: peptidoglycan editing factor PgeF [Rhizobiaceae bacterium]
MSEPSPVRCDVLARAQPAVVHGFFTRNGGVSQGIYRGLNVGLGSGDDRAAILENRRRVSRWLNATQDFLATPHQVHSADAFAISTPWQDDFRPRADAVVTHVPDLPIAVLTADCGPVLFMDGEAGVIGAAHAGWKGATGGILENTVSAMEQLGASRTNLRATLGPTISQDNYEVGPEFVERLLALDQANSRFLVPSQKLGHSRFDLPGYILARLERIGIEAAWTGQCTYADPDRFFSFRRTTHMGESDYGRQISVIMLRS